MFVFVLLVLDTHGLMCLDGIPPPRADFTYSRMSPLIVEGSDAGRRVAGDLSTRRVGRHATRF